MRSDQRIVVLAGTPEIHLPLFRHLQARVLDPVFLVDCPDEDLLRVELTRHARAGHTWIFACSELALNRAESARRACLPEVAGRLHIPGRAGVDGAITAGEISDKAILHHHVRHEAFRAFDLVPAVVTRWDGAGEHLEVAARLRFPIVLKPAVKDAQDSFTAAFAAKIAIARDVEALRELCSRWPGLFLGRDLLIQEQRRGDPVSWCGCIVGGVATGYRITTLVKSPQGESGGTTTLARVEPADDSLSAAVEELADALQLDGVFEIEFLHDEGRYVFLCEINPRPWLQVGAILGSGGSVFTTFLASQGVRVAEGGPPRVEELGVWGSASRYIALNRRAGRLSARTLMRTLRHDVRLGAFFTVRERFAYLCSILLHLLVPRTLRGSQG